jgi:hypothetical protein
VGDGIILLGDSGIQGRGMRELEGKGTAERELSLRY